MKRALIITTVSVLALAGCAADGPDAVPTTTRPPTTDPVRIDVTGTDPDVIGPDTTGPDTTGPVVTDPDATGPDLTTPEPAVRGTFGSARLGFFSDCPDLLQYLRTEASARVTAWGLNGGGYVGPGVPMATDDRATSATDAVAESAVPDVAGAIPGSTVPAYSGTNTQEVGVDEGDMVETNGIDVFVAGQDGVRIIDVADATVVTQLDVPDGAHQLVLDGARLLVVTQPYTGTEDTITSLFDVADAADPTLLRRSHLEGRVVATRSIDGVARLVLTSSLASRLPFVYPQQFGLDEERALDQNRRIIQESAIEAWLPRWFDEGEDGSFGQMSASLECTNVAAPDEFAGLGISWIASVDMRGDQSPVGAAGVVSNGGTVYASSSNIYLATVPWDWYNPVVGRTAPQTQPPTLIHQFALAHGTGASYVASGQVPGTLLNQFAMSELNGDLRVATTTQPDWNQDGTSESMVSVLRPQGSLLVTIGSVGGLGKSEQIYAVRFLGTQAYVVTFRQTDPLYVIDLSDPANPVLSGELKIPGYSAYLHPVGDGLLLGVGQDADVDGRVQGTTLSLFDVSDPSNPQRISSLPIGGYSEAEWDHKAFLYWPEDGTIVIPSSPSWQACDPQLDCLADQLTGAGGGAIVAQLQGTQLVGRGVIEHETSNQTQCWNALQRSMIIGSEIVTIGFDQVKFTDRTTLQGRDQVRWGSPDQYGCSYWVE
jgi:hypothetical protein